MSFAHTLYRRCIGIATGLAVLAIVVSTATTPVKAQSLNQLSAQEQTALRRGQAVVSGRDGQFVGRVLVNAGVDPTWQALTDYGNFARFFPNVEQSRVLQSSGDRHVFEQVNVVRVLSITRRTRVVIASTERYPQQVNFNLVEGDLEAMQGAWRIEPVGSNQVLLSHQVSVSPRDRGPARGIFFSTYRSILEDTLSAIRQESERRAGR